MTDLRILVVEDRERWQEALRDLLLDLGQEVRVDIAATYAEALDRIRNQNYDLVTVDLALRGGSADDVDQDYVGMDLLRELRDIRYNQLRGCGLIVLTAFATTARTHEALRRFAVDDMLEKSNFDPDKFLQIARAAVLSMRLRRAVIHANERYRLLISCDDTRFTGSELSGPDRRAASPVDPPHSFDGLNLARRADNLNLLALNAQPQIWRGEADNVGAAIYQALAGAPRLHSDLTSAQQLGNKQNALGVQFSGPAGTLGVPFELMRDGDDYLALRHAISRRFVQPGPMFSRKPDPFYAFIETLVQRQERLRILIVGSNSDGRIPAAEVEATMLAEDMAKALGYLGVACQIRLLVGADASYERVMYELGEEQPHMLHYAGHGRYNDSRPEVSGLILRSADELRTLNANQINLLVRDTELRLVFLSCCLGARNGGGAGEFRGVLEALARADVPYVLGHRWTVPDEPALELARTFYGALWRSFSPADALLEARRALARGDAGRNDTTWASPVLVAQNG